MYYNDKELIINIEYPEGMTLSAKRKKNKNKRTDYPFCIEIIGEKTEEKKKKIVIILNLNNLGNIMPLFPLLIMIM